MHNCRMLYRDLVDNLVFFDKIKVGRQVFGGYKNQLIDGTVFNFFEKRLGIFVEVF